jgi:hypothetical protein
MIRYITSLDEKPWNLPARFSGPSTSNVARAVPFEVVTVIVFCPGEATKIFTKIYVPL